MVFGFMAGNKGLRIKKYGFFIIYFVADIIILLGVLVMRASSNPHDIGVIMAADNSPVIWALPSLFIVQHLLVFYGFWSATRNEDKYMLFPKDESGDKTYHYFSPQQLLIFIEISSKSINGKDNDYDRIYVTNEPRPNIFSYSLFGRKTIVLHPTILQVAETQELRAGLVIDLELATRSSIIRIYASQHGKFFFIPFIGPLLYFIREIAIIFFFYDPNKPYGENPLQIVLLLMFLILFFFGLMSLLSKILSAFINTANRNYIIHADLKAAEHVGARAVINYLLKYGHRQEAIEVIIDEIQYLEELEKGKIIESLERNRILKLVQKFPIASIDRDQAMEMAPEIFITEKIDVLERIYHCNFPNREELIQQSVDQLLKERRKFVKEWKEKAKDTSVQIPTSVDLQLNLDECINIETFDLKASLNDEEIEVLIKEINKKPKRKLFVHEPAKTSKFKMYPSTADQIIKVNKIEFRG